MGLSLRDIGRSVWEFITPQDEAAHRRNELSNRMAAERLRNLKNPHGIYANPQARQKFIQDAYTPDKFSFGGAMFDSFKDTLTKPSVWDQAPKANVGSFFGSGLIEDFLNSPFKQGKGLVEIGQGDVKKGLGDVVTGSIEGPLGLIPIGKVAQAGRGASLLEKATLAGGQGLKEGAIYGGAYGAGQAASENKNIEEIIKSAAAGAATGGAAGGILGGAAPVVARGAKELIDAQVPLNEVGAVQVPKGKPNVGVKKTTSRRVSYKEPMTGQITNKGKFGGEFQRGAIDKDAPIINYLKKVEKETGQKGLVDQFYYDSGLLRQSPSIALAKVKSSPEVRKAFAGLKKGIVKEGTKQEFDTYAAARNELTMAKAGLKTSKPKVELKKIVDNASPEMKQRFKALNQEYRKIWGERYKAGIIGPKTYKAGIKNPDYSRLQRDMDNLANPPTKGSNAYSLGSTSAKQRRKGSERAVLPADETLFKYRQEVQKEIQKNQVATNLVKVLKEQGVARKVSENKGKNTISFYKNGVKQFYEVPKDIKELADNVSPYQLGIWGQIASAPQRLLRAGATGLSVPFGLANYIRDQVSSGIMSKNVAATHLHPTTAATSLWESAKAFGAETNDPLWQKFIAHVGDATEYNFIRNLEGDKKLSREIRRGIGGKYANKIINPIRTLEDLNQITEKATRFQNFRGIYKDSLKKGRTEQEALQDATLAAWQNSVDFSRMGNAGQVVNLLIPYFNAGIQGTRLLGRRVGEAPIATTAKVAAFAGVPLAAATFYNMSDEKRKEAYDNFSDYEKENNIIIAYNPEQQEDGTYSGVFKIPMQPGISNLIQPLRQAVENMAGTVDPNSFKEMAQQFIGAASGPIDTSTIKGFAGSITPQWVKPAIQQALNTDLFTGKDIIPDYIEEATDAQGNPVPESQKAYESSSGSAKIIGNLFNQSPIRIEKFLKDTTGKVGQYSTNTVDNVLAKLGLISPGEIGGVSAVNDVIRRFGRVTGEYNFKKSEGAKYFDLVKDATKGLNTNELNAYNTLHPAKTNFLGETILDKNTRLAANVKAAAYLQFPKVFAADKWIDQQQRAKGEPGNPLFDLKDNQVAKVLLKSTLPPGAKDPELSNLWDKEWYQDYSTKRDKYYQSVQKSIKEDVNQLKEDLKDPNISEAKRTRLTNDIASREKSLKGNGYPETPPKLQKHMDEYMALPKGTGARSDWINANPGIWKQMTNQWEAVDDWENKERVRLGLNKIKDEDQIGAGGSGGGSGGRFGGGGGSGGGGSRRKSTGSVYQYAVSLSAGGAPARPKARRPAKGGKAKAKSVSKPKVSLKKSKV